MGLSIGQLGQSTIPRTLASLALEQSTRGSLVAAPATKSHFPLFPN